MLHCRWKADDLAVENHCLQPDEELMNVHRWTDDPADVDPRPKTALPFDYNHPI